MNANTVNFSGAIKTQFERRLLSRALSRLVHGKWGMKATLSQYGTLEWRRYESLSAMTTALTQGVTPDEQSAPTLTQITSTPLWYGAWLGFTDQMKVTSFDPVLTWMTGVLGEQAGLSVDTLIRNTLTAGATKDYAGAATQRTDIDTTNDKISYADIVQNYAELEAANARPPDGGMYPVIIHPYTWATLMQDPTFVTLFTREGGQVIRSGRVGTLLNMAFYITANQRSYTDGGASNADVYSALFIGEESFGISGMAGLTPDYASLDGNGASGFFNLTGQTVRPVQLIFKDLGEAGEDRLDQRGSLGWKLTQDEEVLRITHLRDLEHANDFS
jgi:N4-gp56 family major capsid protein